MDGIQKYSSKIILSAIITFLGLVAAIITIYTSFQKSVTKISYEIVTNSNVFDINTNISKLDILYDSTSLKQKNENLRVIRLKVKNVGNINILKTFYDNNSPLGLKIINGYIVELPELVESSTNYIKDNLSIYKNNSDCITFSSIILEPDDYFEIKFLVLHKANITPTVLPIGKIAGIKDINVVNSYDVIQGISFWSKIFIGNIFVQLAKGIIYFFAMILLILSSIGISLFINNKIKLKRRKKIIKDYKNNSKYKHKKIDDYIFRSFVNEGIVKLNQMFRILADEKGINESYQRWQELLKVKEEKEATVRDYISIYDIKLPNGYNASRQDEEDIYCIEMLIEDGFIISNMGGLIVNRNFKRALDSFMEFLKESKYQEGHYQERVWDNNEDIRLKNNLKKSNNTSNT